MRVQRQPKRTGSTRLTRPPRPARQTAATNRRRARAHPPRNANFSRAAAGLVPRAASANRPRHRAQRTSPTPSAGRAASRLTTPTRPKTRWNSLSQKAARSHVRTHARAAGRQAGGQPAFQVTSRPNGRSQARHTNRWRSWNSNYPGCSARCSLRQQVRLVRAYAKRSATYVDVHMDDGVS